MKTILNRTSFLACLLAGLLVFGCGDDGDPEDDCGNGSIDLGEDCEPGVMGGKTCADVGMTGDGLACFANCSFDTAACEAGATGSLSGTITDATGMGVGDTIISVGALSATADWQGVYALADVPVGTQTMVATADWFEEHSVQVQVEENTDLETNVQLTARTLNVTAADAALAATHNQAFDWATASLSVHNVPHANRAEVDKALYYHNPALYRDPTGEAQITPAVLPDINGGATGFDFPIPAGAPNEGQQAIDAATIVDSLAGTPLTADEIAASMMWEPAVKLYLSGWDPVASLSAYYVSLAIEGQRWGGQSMIAPQSLGHLYLHNGEFWVEVVFQSFVDLGAGITDSDGDGDREVFAKLADAHYDASLVAKLVDDYLTPTYDTLGLKNDMQLILDDLYSRTSPEIVSVIGVAYEAAGLGSFEYPFVVLEHSNGVVNVLLVAP